MPESGHFLCSHSLEMLIRPLDSWRPDLESSSLLLSPSPSSARTLSFSQKLKPSWPAAFPCLPFLGRASFLSATMAGKPWAWAPG